jgi:hypothetical protein
MSTKGPNIPESQEIFLQTLFSARSLLRADPSQAPEELIEELNKLGQTIDHNRIVTIGWEDTDINEANTGERYRFNTGVLGGICTAQAEVFIIFRPPPLPTNVSQPVVPKFALAQEVHVPIKAINTFRFGSPQV